MLSIIVSTLLISVILNILLKKIELPTIIGYILTGIIISSVFSLGGSTQNEELKHIAEFGIVFLMFTIGLEFSLAQLKRMRKEVFITGSLQIILTASVVVIMSLYLFELDFKSTLIIGAAIALSSTAIVLKSYNESGEIKKRHGQKVLGILIMQDIAVIPVLLMISLFTSQTEQSVFTMVIQTIIAAAVLLLALYLVGKYLLEPFFEHVTRSNSDEIFIASVLLMAIGASYVAHELGFTYSLGAFLAGMLISETKFKHQVEADLTPFRDLLLGIFFITVGMQIDFTVIIEYLFIILLLLVFLLILKFVIIYGLIRLDSNRKVSFKTAISLVQIGEFSLAIFELARSSELLDATYAQVLMATVVISMVLTPFILKNLSRLARYFVPSDSLMICNDIEIDPEIKGHVVLLGFGHLGVEVARELRKREENYFIVEHNLRNYEDGIARHEPILFGNAAHKHILESVSIKSASAVIIAMHNQTKLTQVCHVVDELTKNTKTIVRVTKSHEKKALEGLHLEHIIVEDEFVAKALVEEVKSCALIYPNET